MQRTVNYDLCQYEGSDKTSYLINYNGDMLKIDTAIKGAKDAADNAQSKANTADGKADANANSISTLDTQINGVSGLAADVETVQGNVNTINSLIGNGTPTTTNKTIIGAINELNSDKCADSKVGDLTNLTTTDKTSVVAAINELASGQGGGVDADDVSYDNTDSGLVATNVQDAIDELAQSGAGAKTVRGTSTANTTWGAQLAELKVVYATLTDAEKREAFIVGSDGYIYHNQLVDGVFAFNYVGGTIFTARTINFSSEKCMAYDGSAVSEVTAQTYADSLSLYA